MEKGLGIVKELFLEVVALPPDQRDATLSRLTADADVVEAVRQLLAHHEQGSPFMDGGVEGAAAAVLDAWEGLPPNAEEFAPYRVVSRLGEGGMGVVFLAVRDDLGMRVAIKVLRDAWLSPSRRKRFATEQRLLARLSHPGIARILDARTLANGTPWFAMEYVDGTGILAHCEASGASILDRVRLFREVCEAIRYAHAAGVVHRDLKPSNILVARDGAVRLLDFGIARAMLPDDQASEGGRTTLALMTPAYAAPEQRERGEPTPRSDVYSLGVILHELVTGRLPGQPAEEGHARPLAPAAPGGGAIPGASSEWPVALERICQKALQADPAMRYEDAGALLADLDRFLAGEPVHAIAPLRHGGRMGARRLLLAGAAVAVIAASLAAWRLVMRTGAPPAVPVVAVLPFSNAARDTTLDYLRHAIGEEVATALGLRRGVSMRAYATTSTIDPDTVDMATVGRVLRVSHVVGGTFAPRSDGGVGVEVRLVRADSGRVLLSAPIVVEPQNAVSLQSQLASLTHGAIAAELGVATQRPDPSATRPRSERAYQLWRYEPGDFNTRAIAMLEEAVRLDSLYAPAWLLLSRRLYIESRYGADSPETLARMLHAVDRAAALEPDYATAGARQAISLIELGRTRGAYDRLLEFVERRPDSPEVHFVLSYVLRFAGMLQESAAECGLALSLDAHNYGWRSCAVPSILMGDREGASGFLALDSGSEWSKAMQVHMHVRAGDLAAARAVGRPVIPQWTSYDLLLACINGRPRSEVDSLAARVAPMTDPESNFFAASHLARCGLASRAFELLQRAIEGGYCAWPVLEGDPMFAPVRGDPRFARMVELGRTCRGAFTAGRG